MLHIVARGSKRGVLSPVFTLVSACEVFVFPCFRYWDFVGFAARVVLVGLYFRPHQDHLCMRIQMYLIDSVYRDTSAGVAFGSVKIAFASSRSLVKSFQEASVALP